MAATRNAWAGSITWENATGQMCLSILRSFCAIGSKLAAAASNSSCFDLPTANVSPKDREVQRRGGAKCEFVTFRRRETPLPPAPNSFGNGAQTRDKLLENIRGKRLRAIALGQLRRIVNLDHERVRTRGQGRQRHLRNKFAQTDGVRWIDNYREMSACFENWHCIQIQRVTCGVFESANAAFTEKNVHVSFVQNVLSAHD